MIEPPSFIRGRAFCTVNSVPLILMLKSLSKCSSVIFPIGANSATPALAKTTSILPFVLTTLVETIEVGQFGNVSLNASEVAADCFHGLVEFFLTTARDEHVGTLFYEELCCSQPDPGCATCNDCYFPCSFLFSVIGCSGPHSPLLSVDSEMRRG
jgi:hypothetical protein